MSRAFVSSEPFCQTYLNLLIGIFRADFLLH